MAFYLEFGSNFSNYAKTIFPYFLVLMCKSLSQMLKNPMTSGERNFYYMAQLLVTDLSPGKCDPQGSITPLGGRWTAQAVKSSDLWPTFASQKLPPRFMEDEMLCKSITNVPGLQERVMLQVWEHMLHLFDLYGHPRVFICAKKWKPSFHCKQMELQAREAENSCSYSPALETQRRVCFKSKWTKQIRMKMMIVNTLPLPQPHSA